MAVQCSTPFEVVYFGGASTSATCPLHSPPAILFCPTTLTLEA
jgi:hypothetical protein